MMWALYANLGQNMWYEEHQKLDFEDEAWEILVDECVKNGIDTIVLDLAEGIRYATHPELAKDGAWTRERTREEIKKLKDKGITIIPKLNFSAGHHLWLGDYRRMMGLKAYYDVCRELIYEVYDLFDKPEYIHLGMDEEDDPIFFDKFDIVAYRQGELLWHDLQFLCDCVRDKGAKPWIWSDIYWNNPEEFKKRIKTDSIILSPWYYCGYSRENYTPVPPGQYTGEKYKGIHFDYIEEEPFHEKPFVDRFFRTSVPCAEAGYDIVPCASLFFNKLKNPDEMVEYFVKNAPAEHLAGFIVAPWLRTNMANIDKIKDNIRLLKEARDKYCK